MVSVCLLPPILFSSSSSCCLKHKCDDWSIRHYFRWQGWGSHPRDVRSLGSWGLCEAGLLYQSWTAYSSVFTWERNKFILCFSHSYFGSLLFATKSNIIDRDKILGCNSWKIAQWEVTTLIWQPITKEVK